MRCPSLFRLTGAALLLIVATVTLPVYPQSAESAPMGPLPGAADVPSTQSMEAMSLVFPGKVGGPSGEEADPPKESTGRPARATPGWTTILYEDAEGSFPADNGWDTYDNNSASGLDYWDDLSCRSYSGSWSVWSADIGDQTDCAHYDNDMTSWMIFGPFSLADASDARAEFRVWSETEAPDIPFDYFFWGASTNGTNFNGFRLTANTGWSLRELDLTNVPNLGDLTGDSSVWFAFVFISDSTVSSYEGSYVDEILIEKLVPNQTDLVATNVYFRDQPGNVGNIINDPTPSDVLYPHFTFSVNGTSNVSGTIWQLEINGNSLCSSTTTLSPGSWVGWCTSPISLLPGLHSLHGELDPNHGITETNEGNNDAFHNYTVDGGDPPGAFSLSNEPPVCDTGPPGPSPAVRLNWTQSNGATSYDVYRDSVLYSSGVTGTTFYNSANVTAGQSYSYFIRAKNDVGTKDSNTIIVSVPSDVCSADIRVEPLTLTFDGTAGPQAVAATEAGGVSREGPPRVGTESYASFFDSQVRSVEYVGHIVDQSGTPLSGTYPLELRYFGAGSEPSFVETFDRVEVSDGELHVTLGSGTAAPHRRYRSIEGFFADHPSATMEVRVAGTVFEPRVGILPAGHSLESRLVSLGLREGTNGSRHWEGYRSRNGATALEAVTLAPRGSAPASDPSTRTGERRHPFTLPVVGPVLSAPVRDLPVIRSKVGRPPVEVNPPRHEGVTDANGNRYGTTTPKIDDTLAGSQAPTASSPTVDFDFEGIGNLSGVLPPDTEGAVGPDHYVQVVNDVFAIYDKGGNLLAGPVATNTLWDNFGGPCDTDNSGDAIFLYDQQANRFVLSQFAVASNHHSVCFAVSQSSDPTGAYYLYEVVTPRFPDYYKVGVWPDPSNNAYFFGTNSGFKGQYDVFALDRARMVAGTTARAAQFFQSFDNLMMPADVDGASAPPAGSPGLFYTFRDGGEPYFDSPATDSLDLWEFDVDWTTPANSTFTLAQSFTPAGGLAEFNWTVCGFFAADCIPQPGTSQGIDSASWWPMQRLVYRNFGAHESLVGSWTVNVSSAGIRAAPRWFELRNSGSGWSIYQQGTHSPDAIHRWMPSVAMDGSGNLAMGYSRGDGAHYPSIYYATRAAGDPVGTLQTEALLQAGTGSQTHSAGRWGDYSSMEIDPADDCTFWYTTEYLQTTSSATWHTRVGTFSIPGCSSAGDSKSFTIFNDGGETLQVSSLALDSPASWISWSPGAPISLTGGSSQQVTVTVDFAQAPTGQSTRRLLVTSNDGDESPYPGGVNIVVNHAAVSCYLLTLTHSGTGSDPVASPASSTGCSSGEYHAGETVSLTASPGGGWKVGGWSGTSNDGSTSQSNSLVMPSSAHTASVSFVPAGGPPNDLVLSDQTLAAPGTYEACGSVTLGPNLVLTAGGAGIVVRAPIITFIPEVKTLTGAIAVFDNSTPDGCP